MLAIRVSSPFRRASVSGPLPPPPPPPLLALLSSLSLKPPPPPPPPPLLAPPALLLFPPPHLLPPARLAAGAGAGAGAGAPPPNLLAPNAFDMFALALAGVGPLLSTGSAFFVVLAPTTAPALRAVDASLFSLSSTFLNAAPPLIPPSKAAMPPPPPPDGAGAGAGAGAGLGLGFAAGAAGRSHVVSPVSALW